jgi:hypothetical protein
MRHLIGIACAIAMAAALFFATTWGYVQLTARAAQVSRLPGGGAALLSDHSALAALIAVAGTGLLAGILIGVPRISPLAAGLPGLLLLGITAQYLVSAQRALNLIPLRSHAFGTGLVAMLSAGLLGAAGLAMIVPLFVPSRWRTRRSAAGPADSEPEDSELVSALPQSPEPAPPAGYPEPATRAQAFRPAQGTMRPGQAPATGARPYVSY